MKRKENVKKRHHFRALRVRKRQGKCPRCVRSKAGSTNVVSMANA